MNDVAKLAGDIERDQKKLIVVMAVTGIVLTAVVAGLPYLAVGGGAGGTTAALMVFAVFLVLVPVVWLTGPMRSAAWKSVLAAPESVRSAHVVQRMIQSGQHVRSTLEVEFRNGQRVRMTLPVAFEDRALALFNRSGGVPPVGPG